MPGYPLCMVCQAREPNTPVYFGDTGKLAGDVCSTHTIDDINAADLQPDNLRLDVRVSLQPRMYWGV